MIVKIYLDEERVHHNEPLHDENCNYYRSDKELEKKMCRGTRDAMDREQAA